jgi:hypothetical protein
LSLTYCVVKLIQLLSTKFIDAVYDKKYRNATTRITSKKNAIISELHSTKVRKLFLKIKDYVRIWYLNLASEHHLWPKVEGM